MAARSLALFEQQGGTADEARDVRHRRVVSGARSAVKNATDRLRETLKHRESLDPGQVV
jgi:hypothetical protein